MRYYLPATGRPVRGVGQLVLAVDYSRPMLRGTVAGAAAGAVLGFALAAAAGRRRETNEFTTALGGLVFGSLTGLVATVAMKSALETERQVTLTV